MPHFKVTFKEPYDDFDRAPGRSFTIRASNENEAWAKFRLSSPNAEQVTMEQVIVSENRTQDSVDFLKLVDIVDRYRRGDMSAHEEYTKWRDSL